MGRGSERLGDGVIFGSVQELSKLVVALNLEVILLQITLVLMLFIRVIAVMLLKKKL